MLNAYTVRFDVTENLKKFCELNEAWFNMDEEKE